MNVLGSKRNHAHANIQCEDGTFMYLFDRLEHLGITCNRIIDDYIQPPQSDLEMLQFDEGFYGFYTDFSSQILAATQAHPNHHIALTGYMQNEKYFSNHRENILKMFSLPMEVTTSGELPIHGTVALHVRLGDFKNNARFFIDLNHYYEQAMLLARERFCDVNFVIVCEEPNLVARYYPTLLTHANTRVLEKLDELHTFDFMTKCSGVIIANSSFSWWAAWMNQTPDKFITIPSRFINDDIITGTLSMDSQGAIIVDV